ncbi:MAG: hypothetical protein JWM05_3026 [Acidimicrobiales bacterium]|nr:hypothetical protein [Acidimicrobiales bacterium]
MTTTRVVAHVPDLMDRSRLAALPGIDLVVVADPAQLASVAGPDDVIVVDLGRPGVLAAIAAGLPGRVVGFASHVDRELLAAAAAAGCPDPLPRSRFFGRLAEVLEGRDA